MLVYLKGVSKVSKMADYLVFYLVVKWEVMMALLKALMMAVK